MHTNMLKFAAVLLLSCQFFPPALGAQDESPVQLASYLVSLDAIVLGKNRKTAINNLNRDDFVVEEDGKRQTITHFSKGELPLSVLLLLDVSGSVRPMLEEIQRAAEDALSLLKADDRVAVMIFAAQTRLLVDLTDNRALIAQKLDEMIDQRAFVGAATHIDNALFEACRYLSRRTAPSDRRAIVMITDDKDTRYFREGPARDVVLKGLYQSGVAVFGITVNRASVARKVAGIGITGALVAHSPFFGGIMIANRLLNHHHVGSAKYYAVRTGGIALYSKFEEIAATFVGMMELLRTRYTIGYVPSNLGNPGKFHKVKVAISDQVARREGGVVVLTRNGYYFRHPSRLKIKPL